LLAMPSRCAYFGDNARKFAADNFALERICAGYEVCCQTLLEKKGVRTSLARLRTTAEPRNG
jgi:hypothetical protein